MIGEEATKRIKESNPGVFLEVCREFEKVRAYFNRSPTLSLRLLFPVVSEKFTKTHQGKKLKSIETVLSVSA